MRKLEIQMIQAIQNGYSKQCGSNTRVAHYQGFISVFQHENCIATLDRARTLTLSNCGWESVTTKGRLNALLSGLGTGAKIAQKAGVWYLNDKEGKITEWQNGTTFNI